MTKKKTIARNKAIVIGETTVSPGERKYVYLPVADLYTTTSVNMPVEVICGRRAGPVMFVSAAVHGDELNGIEIIRRLLNRKVLASIRGTLLVVPVVNVHGFLNQSRYLPDRRDLNRSFPGSAKGSIAARLANTFLNQIVAKADYGLDLHTGAVNRSNLPQIRGNLEDPRTLELARSFGVPVIINANVRDGSLRACAADREIPMLIYEAGEALRFDEMSIAAGIRGILNVMYAVGMLAKPRHVNKVMPMLAQTMRWVRAPVSGLVSGKAQLGSSVLKGERLAVIGDPLGKAESTLTAPFDGIVIGCSMSPLAHEGDALFNLAAFKSIDEAEELVEEFQAAYDPEPRDN